MYQWLLRMLLGCVLLITSADAGMVRSTPDEYFVDTGTFFITIAKNSGKLTRLRIRNTPLNIVSLWPHYGLFFVETETHGPNGENAGCWPGVDVFTEPTLLFDSDSLAVIHFDWNAPKISATWTYYFHRDRNFFSVDTRRRVLESTVFTNFQNCMMVRPQFEHSYLVDYAGQWIQSARNFEVLIKDPGENSMFTYLDMGPEEGERFPACAWGTDQYGGLICGAMVTHTTANQRPTMSYTGMGSHFFGTGDWAKYEGCGEGQWDWFGKADSESLYMHEGTEYGMEMVYYVGHGDGATFDAFNRSFFRKGFFDERPIDNYWAASYGGRRKQWVGYNWDFPSASNAFITTQNMNRYRGLIIPASQNGFYETQLVDVDMRYWPRAGRELELTPINSEPDGVLHDHAEVVDLGDTMIGRMRWNVEGMLHTMEYQLYADSDKLVVSGEVFVSAAVMPVRRLAMELRLGKRIDRVIELADRTWEVSASDPVLGRIGMTFYDMEGIERVEQHPDRLSLVVLDHPEPQSYRVKQHWNYRFVVYPHVGPVDDAGDVPAFFSMPDWTYREYYLPLPGLSEDRRIGMRPSLDASPICASEHSDGDEERLEVVLYTRAGEHLCHLVLGGRPVPALFVDGQPVPNSHWHLNVEGSRLTLKRDWTEGLHCIEVGSSRLDEGVVYTGETHETKVALLPNAPNPFSGETMIPFALPAQTGGNVTIYNLLGQIVRRWRIREEGRAAGYQIRWDGKDQKGRSLSSGIYVCRLIAGNTVRTRRIVLTR